MYVKKLNEDMDGLEVLFQARDNKLIEITWKSQYKIDEKLQN